MLLLRALVPECRGSALAHELRRHHLCHRNFLAVLIQGANGSPRIRTVISSFLSLLSCPRSLTYRSRVASYVHRIDCQVSFKARKICVDSWRKINADRHEPHWKRVESFPLLRCCTLRARRLPSWREAYDRSTYRSKFSRVSGSLMLCKARAT